MPDLQVQSTPWTRSQWPVGDSDRNGGKAATPAPMTVVLVPLTLGLAAISFPRFPEVAIAFSISVNYWQMGDRQGHSLQPQCRANEALTKTPRPLSERRPRPNPISQADDRFGADLGYQSCLVPCNLVGTASYLNGNTPRRSWPFLRRCSLRMASLVRTRIDGGCRLIPTLVAPSTVDSPPYARALLRLMDQGVKAAAMGAWYIRPRRQQHSQRVTTGACWPDSLLPGSVSSAASQQAGPVSRLS